VPAVLLKTLGQKGKEWEPVVGGNMPSPEKGSGGVKLVSPVFTGIYGDFQFSLLNGNKKPIENVTYLLIFKKGSQGDVLHYILRKERDLLPPGLAKRFSLEDRSLEGFMVTG